MSIARSWRAGDGRRIRPKESPSRTVVVLDVADLHAGYGEVPVLHGVSLQLARAKRSASSATTAWARRRCCGPSWACCRPRGGKIVIDGVDVTGWAAHERSRLGIAYVPQGRGILPGLSAHENLRLAWTPDSGETEERAIERVLGIFPRLTRLLDRRGGALSGGEQQILALARALMPLPWLLLLDEPSEGIQPSIVQEIGELLATLAREAPALDADRRAEPRTRARRRKPHRAGRARAHHPRTRRRRRARRRDRRTASGSATRAG